MVTELLEGETLRERLDEDPLSWRKATEIGAAIADGLAAAHTGRHRPPGSEAFECPPHVRRTGEGARLRIGSVRAG